MDLTGELQALAARIRAADTVAAIGGGTQAGVGNPVVGDVTSVHAPAGVVSFEPADLTVTVGAGTTVGDLDAALTGAGQEVPLDPPLPGSTVGGVLACGLSGHRRLRFGPLRDRLLEVRFVTGDGRLVKGGGPTVKNVTGFDLPRLLVGSLGTLGVIGQVTLRTSPRAPSSWWGCTDRAPQWVLDHAYRPSAVLWDGSATRVLLEGTSGDVAVERAALSLEASDPPSLPSGPHLGRISVRPGALATLGPQLSAAGCRWLAEAGVGTVHVEADEIAGLARARAVAAAAGGWLLREAGAVGLDGFGAALPNPVLTRRLKAAFDPGGRLAPGRVPVAP